ncbi:unnamed protein product, partial [Gongylonema pulchrum]|uniref:Protein kinase domain-containing protein n=1 Tax=Gongylonema pulchrum TaxID=637853 RepID=A0A183DGN6_9BILA
MSEVSGEGNALQKYTKIEKLGGGTFGVVYKCIHNETGKFVAMKKIREEFKDEGVPSKVIREIAVLKELDHPNIVAFVLL